MEFKVTTYERLHPETFRSAYLRAARGLRMLNGYFTDGTVINPMTNPAPIWRMNARTFDIGSAHSCALGQCFEPFAYYETEYYDNGLHYNGWDLGRELLSDSGWMPDPIPEGDDYARFEMINYFQDLWYANGFISCHGIGGPDYMMLNRAWSQIISDHQRLDFVG